MSGSYPATWRAHPRSRGENSSLYLTRTPLPGSSPLTRGKLGNNLASALPSGLIPAHAGKTRTLLHQSRAPRAHPRSRGENKLQEALKANAAGSSPLTRGKPLLHRTTQARERLIPAHAGKTPSRSGHTAQAQAHPRSRGENVLEEIGGDVAKGSSPLTRGKPARRSSQSVRQWLIPAHAGKTGGRLRWSMTRGAHPRSRGENVPSVLIPSEAVGSSPLTRGKRGPYRTPVSWTGLIPAHAGKTQATPFRCRGTRAHPRSRGENRPILAPWIGVAGSSPLTRGKHSMSRIRRRRRRLIPAHAGKTETACSDP